MRRARNHRVACLAAALAAVVVLSSAGVADTGSGPAISAFELPRQSRELAFAVMSLRATGNVTGYRITRTPIPPTATQPGWSAKPPDSITEGEPGVYDYYAWVKDKQGRVSRFAEQTVDVATTKVTVGPQGRDFTNFADAIRSIADRGNPKGVVIEADAGEYGSWRRDGGFPEDSLKNIIKVVADNLTIRGVGGRAHLAYKCRGATSKDRWTIPPGGTQHGSVIVQSARNLRLENIEVSGGCNANTMNGAGLWVEPGGVGTVLRNCYFHHNDNGILSSKIPGSRIVIMNSEFFQNGAPGPAAEGQNHNIYVGEIDELVFMFNYSHSSYRGQLLKSRAGRNYVLYNRLTDEDDSNYPIDLPYGGESYIIGNLVHMSKTSRSATFINYGREVVLKIDYQNGGLEPLKDGDEVNNARTGKRHKLRYNFNYVAKGKWESRDRASFCTLILTEADRPDFRPGDRLTYGTDSSIEVVSAAWAWSSPRREIHVCNNTFVNECSSGYGQYLLRAHPDTHVARLQNNLIIDLKPPRNPYKLHLDASDKTKERPVSEEASCWGTADPGFTDITKHDYSLSSSAVAAIDRGIDPGSTDGMSLAPVYHYVHERGFEARPTDGEIDIGAYEGKATSQPADRKEPAAGPAATQREFRMNPRLASLPDKTWLKMSPKFVYHPDQLSALDRAGRKPEHFCHFKGEASLCYDESANLTLYFGGCTSGYGNNHWVYDCSSDIWTQIHPDVFKLNEKGLRYREDTKAVPPGCCCYGMCYDSDRKVSVLCRPNGGATGWVGPEQPPNNLAWLYDAVAKNWIFTPVSGDVRPTVYITGVRLAYDPERKECLLFSGLSRTLWAYRTAENMWRKIDVEDPRPGKAGLASWVYMSREKKFLLFGGRGEQANDPNTTWVFDPAQRKWENVTPRDGPGTREGAAMAYDSLNNVAVMIGGWSEAPSKKLNDGTWVFEPTKKTWTQLKPDPIPPVAGNVYQTAYDVVNNVIVYVTTEKGSPGFTWVYRYKNAALSDTQIR